MTRLGGVFLFLCLAVAVSGARVGKPKKQCKTKAGKIYQVGEGYSVKCDVFTCKKIGKKYRFDKTFNSTHCCQTETADNNIYQVGDIFNSTRLNFSCSVKQLKCVEVSNFTKAAMVVEMYHHGLCCAYRHLARNQTEYFDEFYNGTLLDRNTNFTLHLEINETLAIPEKCLNLTCIQDNPWGLPVLVADEVYRSCNCCYYNSTMYQEGTKNITLSDGRNASCCGGQLVIPETILWNITNSTQPHRSRSVYNGSQVTPAPSTAPTAPDSSLCYASCFDSSNSYHNQFLAIIQTLLAAQAATKSQGVAFVLDSSLHNSTSSYIYKYERNIAMLLSLTLPINTTNPMFVTKYANYGSCSWYDPSWCCNTDKCDAAKTLAGPTPNFTNPSISTYQQVAGIPGFGLGQPPYLGMLWHGTALAHGAFNDTTKNTCATTTKNQLVIPIINKEWHQGLGGGGAFDETWHTGPQGQNRTVATIGVDLAPLGPMQEAATNPGLAWKLGSTQDWHTQLVSLLHCLDTSCCAGTISSSTGIPTKRSGKVTFIDSQGPGSLAPGEGGERERLS